MGRTRSNRVRQENNRQTPKRNVRTFGKHRKQKIDFYDNSMDVSSLKLKRATGLMTKGRREIQKRLSSGLIVAPSYARIATRSY